MKKPKKRTSERSYMQIISLFNMVGVTKSGAVCFEKVSFSLNSYMVL